MSKSKELPPTRRSSLMQRFALLGISVSTALLFKGDNNLNNAFAGDLSSGHALVGAPALPFVSNEGEQNTNKLREKIADEFGIEIQTLDEVSTAATAARIFNGLEGLLFSYQDWNEQNLNLLEHTLENLPEKFYQPDENGEKVHIILGPLTHCGSSIKNFMPFYPREIMLSSLYFRPEIPLSATWVLAHEFGHLVTTDSCRQTDSPYLDKIEEILGGNFDQIKQDLSGEIQTQAEQSDLSIEESGFVLPIDSIKTPVQEAIVRLTRLKYGLSNQEEFIAVIAESYFLGKNYFQRMYAPFFPQDVVDNLYEFARYNIFDGTEYPDYPYYSCQA